MCLNPPVRPRAARSAFTSSWYPPARRTRRRSRCCCSPADPGKAPPTSRASCRLASGRSATAYDLLLIDQRGTGQSNGLHCVAPPAVADLMGRIFDANQLAACRDELSRRADLTRYTTAASAADYEIIFDALAVRRVHVWGVSYGTRLGYEIARRIPDRVRTLTLESVVPVTFNWPSTGATRPRRRTQRRDRRLHRRCGVRGRVSGLAARCGRRVRAPAIASDCRQRRRPRHRRTGTSGVVLDGSRVRGARHPVWRWQSPSGAVP